MSTSKDPQKFTAEDKLHYEVEKLKLEATVLRRPYIKQPTTWVTITGLMISIALNLSQCSKTKNEADMAEIRLARTQLLQERANKQADSIRRATALLDTQRKNTQLQLDNMQRRVADAQKSLSVFLAGNTTTNMSQQSNEILSDVKSSLNQIGKINTTVVKDFSNPKSVISYSADLSKAKDKEREAFQDLIDGNFTAAAIAFQAAEDAYNGYHWSYELARLLKNQTNKGLTTDADKKALLRLIVTKYFKGAPSDLMEQLKKLTT